jgi:hypothetical protein
METKLEAIAHLENVFKNNPEYKKAWADYIELCIIEELENNKIKIPTEKEIKLVKDCSSHILSLLFNANWWEAQQ